MPDVNFCGSAGGREHKDPSRWYQRFSMSGLRLHAGGVAVRALQEAGEDAVSKRVVVIFGR